MEYYPWNLLKRAILEKGNVEIHIHGLEELSIKELFQIPAIRTLREIQMQLDNPDLTDGEKIKWIKYLLKD